MTIPAASSRSTSTDNGVLLLDGLGVAFGGRVVLSSVTLSVPERGVVVLLGPGGTGKSTLLRTLAGHNTANPSLRTWGEAVYAGTALGAGDLPALVSQSARLLMASVFDNIVTNLPERQTLTHLQQRDLARRLLERAGLAALTSRLDEPVVTLPLAVQRHLAILRLAAAAPRLLCIDEPTTGLAAEECPPLLDYIRAESAHRAILVVLHNQVHARYLGGHVALLAGGVIQEMRPTDDFFRAPRSAAAREFVRNGCCSVPSPDARPEDLEPHVEAPPPLPEPARVHVSAAFGPRGFLWLKKGILAGTPRPGIFLDLDYDLEALRRVGVTTLITLQRTPMPADALERFGLRNIHSPIPDMDAPPLEQAAALCGTIDELIAENETVAVHCRAGLGRTGTMLAAYLIWEGRNALEALESVRRIEPRWVQSERQVAFLEEFARAVANGVPVRRAGTSKTPVS